MSALYNAVAEVLRETPRARVIRVRPDRPKRSHLGGQYGSLGLASDADPAKLVKRAYSISHPVLDPKTRELVALDETDWLEFYFNRVEPAPGREGLTPKLFALKTGDRLFCGEKITGHCTLERVPRESDLLLVSTTTGEAAANSILADFLAQGRPGAACSLVLGDAGWESLYRAQHAALATAFPRARVVALSADDALARAETLLAGALADPEASRRALGFALAPGRSHVFLIGDPAMIGAPRKLGAWNYEAAAGGLLPLLSAKGFTPATRFKEGDIDHESYW